MNFKCRGWEPGEEVFENAWRIMLNQKTEEQNPVKKYYLGEKFPEIGWR